MKERGVGAAWIGEGSWADLDLEVRLIWVYFGVASSKQASYLFSFKCLSQV